MFGSRRFNVWRVAARRLGSKPVVRMVLACGAMAMWAAADMVSQDRASDMGGIRGDHAELSITIKENSSQLIGPLVTVKVYRRGTLSGQMTTSKGRTVFILNELGDYVITADAIGYRSAQKDISVPVAVAAEEEIVLQRDSTEALGRDARPLLAPKAKQATDKALQALKVNKLDQAEKFLDEAAKLAPNHPDVLYLQGVVSLQRNQPEKIKLAVLPFGNLNADPEQDYFSNGLTEEMITEITRLQPLGYALRAGKSVLPSAAIRRRAPGSPTSAEPVAWFRAGHRTADGASADGGRQI